MSASYGWIVEVDHLTSSHPAAVGKSRVGRLGPRNIAPATRDRLLHPADDEPDVRRWRCRDDDGELYYEGRFIGPESQMFGPLEDFATPDAGATTIEYLDGGEWRAL